MRLKSNGQRLLKFKSQNTAHLTSRIKFVLYTESRFRPICRQINWSGDDLHITYRVISIGEEKRQKSSAIHVITNYSISYCNCSQHCDWQRQKTWHIKIKIPQIWVRNKQFKINCYKLTRISGTDTKSMTWKRKNFQSGIAYTTITLFTFSLTKKNRKNTLTSNRFKCGKTQKYNKNTFADI